IGFQRDGLIDGRCLTVGGALAIDQTELPAEPLDGLLDTVAHPQCSAVALILRRIDDEFAWLSRGTVRRTVPHGDWRSRCGNQCFGRGQRLTACLGGNDRRRYCQRLRRRG